MTDDKAREEAWQSYLAKMRALDAQNNLAGRGMIPSWRDWHAGWDARAAVLGDRDTLREKIARVISEAESQTDEEGAWALPEDVADAVLDVLYGGDGSSSNTERSEQ